MVRLFALGGLFVDVAGSVVSLVGDGDQIGMPVWMGINVVVFALPLAIRIGEPLLVAISDAPEVLSIDETPPEESAF